MNEKTKELERLLHEKLQEAVSSFLTDMQDVDVKIGATIVCYSIISTLMGVSKFLSPDETFYNDLINAHVENLLYLQPDFKPDDQCYLLGKREFLND